MKLGSIGLTCRAQSKICNPSSSWTTPQQPILAPFSNLHPTITCCTQNEVTTILFCRSHYCRKILLILLREREIEREREREREREMLLIIIMIGKEKTLLKLVINQVTLTVFNVISFFTFSFKVLNCITEYEVRKLFA